MKTVLRGKPLGVRFAALVDRRGPEECWPWKGRVDRDGYGRIQSGDQSNVGAHRLALEEALGRKLELGEVACHRCDNRLCCNPAHLFVGSIQDNNQDAVAKERNAFGERHGHARLTEAQVIEIRSRRAAGARVLDLASEYGVSGRQIYNIAAGKKWAHTAAATARSVSRQAESEGGAA